jgi:hypothetical protein
MRRLFYSACLAFTLMGFAVLEACAVGTGGACAGTASNACNAGLWCDLGAGSCGLADRQGTCVRVPAFCTLVYRAVCGCNGHTYGNDCERMRARVSKSHDGACAPGDRSRRGREAPDSEPDARSGGR